MRRQCVVGWTVGLACQFVFGCQGTELSRHTDSAVDAPEAEVISEPSEGEASSIVFVRNDGQLPENVLFYSEANGPGQERVYVTREGLTFDWHRTSQATSRAHHETVALGFESTADVRMSGIESAQGVGIAPGELNFYVGPESQWRSHVPRFARVSARLSNGLTLELYARNQRLEFDLVENAPGQIAQTRIQIRGADHVATVDNDLNIRVGERQITLPAPVAFSRDQHLALPYRYAVYANSLTFELPASFGGRAVVDPVVFSTYLGGSQFEGPKELPVRTATLSNGDVVVVSFTDSPDYPTTVGAWDQTLAASDAIITRLSANNLVFSTYLGGSSGDSAEAVTIGPSDLIFVAGRTSSADFPANVNDTTLGGPLDGFIATFTAAGSLNRATYLGGSGIDNVRDIAADSAGNVYVVGSSTSRDISHPLMFACAGTDRNAFFARFGANLATHLWENVCGSNSDEFSTVAVREPMVFVGGWSDSSDLLPIGWKGFAVQTMNGGGYDGVVLAIDMTGYIPGQPKLWFGGPEWGTYYGGSGDDLILDVVPGKDLGDMFVGGTTTSVNFPTVLGAFDTTLGGGGDLFIAHLRSGSDHALAATLLGSSANESDQDVHLHYQQSGPYADSIWVSSGTTGSDFPVSSNALQHALLGSEDAVLVALDGQLESLSFGTYLGGTNNAFESGASLLMSDDGFIWAGVTSSADFPVTAGSYDTTFNGQTDLFIYSYTFCDADFATTGMNPCTVDAPICNGGICVDCSTSGHCNDGNPCTVDSCSNSTCVFAAVANGTQCRAAASSCDVAETCLNGACPVDGFISMGISCRGSTGLCDPGEVCTGASANCPPDVRSPAGTTCRAAAGDCDVAEVCDGLNASCPVDVLRNSSFQCRGSAGDCDLAENCSGSSATCPADLRRPLGFQCRAINGLCDAAETCDGVATLCPADGFLSGGTQCRGPSGDCDVAETCSGSNASCPADGFANSGTACAGGVCNGTNMCVACTLAIHCDDSNPCTVDMCDGGNSCRYSNASAGTACGGGLSCNGAGVCAGCTMGSQCADGNSCTDDVCTLGSCSNPNLPMGTGCAGGVCRNGSPSTCVACVVDANCGGATPFCNTATNQCVQCLNATQCSDSNACTTDQCNAGTCQYVPVSAGTVCRGSAGLCDRAEVCNGTASPCPADGKEPQGTICNPSLGVCDIAEVCDGTSNTCPANQRAALGTPCRAAAGLCDIAESCSGLADNCPADVLRPSSFECRLASGACDQAEFCSGSNTQCPADTFLGAGVTCPSGVCNGSGSCAECVSDTHCDDSDPCTVDTCSGSSCTSSNAGAGTPCGSGLVCDGSGVCSGCTMAAQCDDANPCTSDSCDGGNCEHVALNQGDSCPGGVCRTGGTPTCVDCVDDDDCSGETSRCNPATNQCAECISNAHCDDGNDCTLDLCDTNVCVSSAAPDGTSCNLGQGMCVGGSVPRCVECMQNSDCPAERPFCLPDGPMAGTCGGCLTSSDCSNPTPVCDPSTNTCAPCNATLLCPSGASCTSSGTCSTGCSSDTDCAAPTPTCEVGAGTCAGCGSGTIVCGAEAPCDPESGRCGLDPNGDADQDGIVNGIECATGTNCRDTDGDSTPDYLDPDDDGDSLTTASECPAPQSCRDTNGDNVPDYLDDDDDGDGIPTSVEAQDGAAWETDTDFDGLQNWLDPDADGDGSRDGLEGRGTSPSGRPFYLDAAYLGGGGLAGGSLRCTARGGRTPFSGTWMICLGLLFVARFRKRE